MIPLENKNYPICLDSNDIQITAHYICMQTKTSPATVLSIIILNTLKISPI